MSVLAPGEDSFQNGTLLLASSSPRRRSLLESVGIDLEILSVDIDETPDPDLNAEDNVAQIAMRKWKAGPVRRRLVGDTIVVNDRGDVLGKPRDREHAKEMLRSLSGKAHRVLTAFVLGKHSPFAATVETKIRFRDLSAEEVSRYVDSGDADDKAGSYAIQGGGGAFVDTIHGSYTNVVGLPLAEVLAALEQWQK